MGILQNTIHNHVREEHRYEIEELIRSICKDGIVTSSEKDRLFDKAKHYYYSTEELESMIMTQLESSREEFREETLPSLIEEACRDTIVTDNERQGLYDKAKVWKVSEEEVDVLIEQALSRRAENLARRQAAIDTASHIVSAVGSGIGSMFRGIGGYINKAQENRHQEKMMQHSQQPTVNQQTVTPPIPETQSNKTYMLAIGGQQYGPYPIEQLKQMIPTKQFTEQTMVWTAGMPAWTTASQVQELALLFAPAMPATPPMPPTPEMPPVPGAPQMPPMP